MARGRGKSNNELDIKHYVGCIALPTGLLRDVTKQLSGICFIPKITKLSHCHNLVHEVERAVSASACATHSSPVRVRKGEEALRERIRLAEHEIITNKQNASYKINSPWAYFTRILWDRMLKIRVKSVWEG